MFHVNQHCRCSRGSGSEYYTKGSSWGSSCGYQIHSNVRCIADRCSRSSYDLYNSSSKHACCLVHTLDVHKIDSKETSSKPRKVGSERAVVSYQVIGVQCVPGSFRESRTLFARDGRKVDLWCSWAVLDRVLALTVILAGVEYENSGIAWHVL